MRIHVRSVVFGGLLGVEFIAWRGNHHDDVARAVRHAAKTPIAGTRLYTGPDNRTHAEPMDVKLTPHVRMERNEQSKSIKAAGFLFSRRSPGFVTDWHPSSQATYQITLSGRGEIDVSGGQTIAVSPGHLVLLDDMTGEGHRARTLGTEDWVVMLVQVDHR